MAAGRGSGGKGGRRLPAACTFYGQVRDLAGGNWVGMPHPAPGGTGTPSFDLLSELLRTLRPREKPIVWLWISDASHWQKLLGIQNTATCSASAVRFVWKR